MTLLQLFYFAGGLLLSALAIPLIQRRIKPNPWYGFRVPQTLNNPTVWYEANAYAGRWLLAAGLITSLASLVIALIPGLSIDSYAIATTAVILIALFLTFIFSWRYLQSIRQ
jgi:uncharacterized membrane protein